MEKFRITAYFLDQPDKLDKSRVFQAIINPDKWDIEIVVPKSVPVVEGTKTSIATYPFKFIFDATGVVTVDGKPVKTPVDEQYKSLQNTLFVDGKENRVLIEYGKMQALKAIINNLSVSYTHFRADGTPFRAVVNAVFREMPDVVKKTSEATGYQGLPMVSITPKTGDRLDQVLEDVQGNSDNLIYTAKQNKLKTLYELPADKQVQIYKYTY